MHLPPIHILPVHFVLCSFPAAATIVLFALPFCRNQKRLSAVMTTMSAQRSPSSPVSPAPFSSKVKICLMDATLRNTNSARTCCPPLTHGAAAADDEEAAPPPADPADPPLYRV